MTETTPADFKSLGLPAPLVSAVCELGYEVPSPIQEQSIPSLLEGRDVLGTAQTGTCKTAAFALPILARTQVDSRNTQVLCLATTRELAMQVAEAVQSYSKYTPGVKVCAVYGGTSYTTQIK